MNTRVQAVILSNSSNLSLDKEGESYDSAITWSSMSSNTIQGFYCCIQESLFEQLASRKPSFTLSTPKKKRSPHSYSFTKEEAFATFIFFQYILILNNTATERMQWYWYSFLILTTHSHILDFFSLQSFNFNLCVMNNQLSSININKHCLYIYIYIYIGIGYKMVAAYVQWPLTPDPHQL